MAFADIKKAVSAVNGKIQLAIVVEVYGEFAEGGIRQRQDLLHPAGCQNLKGYCFIVAAQIEALVKALLTPLTDLSGLFCAKTAVGTSKPAKNKINIFITHSSLDGEKEYIK